MLLIDPTFILALVFFTVLTVVWLRMRWYKRYGPETVHAPFVANVFQYVKFGIAATLGVIIGGGTTLFLIYLILKALGTTP